MVAIYEPETLTKIGIFDGDLESTVMKFNPKIMCMPLGSQEVIKYALYEESPEPYLLMISQQKQKLSSYIGNILHNTTLTITSDSEKLNQKIYENFEQKTGISLLDAPEEYARLMKNIGSAFSVFKEKGLAAMIFLQKLS